MKRIFIAADIDQDIRENIHNHAKINFSYSHNIRPVTIENLHITFRFINSISDKEISGIKEAVRMSVSGCSGFKYGLNDGTGAFPHKREAKVLYISIGKGRGDFERLYSSISSELDRLGITRDHRDYYPHITIARLNPALNIENKPDCTGPIITETLKCSSISLYESILGPGGAKYINLARFGLK